MSRMPSVVTNAVLAPLRSIRAFVARVVPCTNTETSDGGSPAAASTRRIPSRTPTSGAAVVSTLAVSRPAGLSRTTSVNVPPMSAASLARITPRLASDRYLLESRITPDFALEHAAQARYGDPHILVADRHGRDAEAHDVRLSERAHHAVLEQGLTHRSRDRVTEADVPALLVVLARRGDGDTEPAALLLEERDRQLGQRAVLPLEILSLHVAPDVDRRRHRLVRD